MGDMRNFTVGPVQSNECVRRIGFEQIPYFRTPEFSAIMLENEKMILSLLNAPEGSRAVFITGSGTASMEAVVMGLLDEKDSVLVVDGGSFGSRFCQMCDLHKVPFERIDVKAKRILLESDLAPYDGKGGHNVFIVNIDETSTGVLYDMPLISAFCKRNNLLLVVDAISSFLADPLDMEASGIDVVITGSQKALACPPGISITALSSRALDKINRVATKCMYLDLKDALRNGERGQTPFTPAVGILLQIHERLSEIVRSGGAESEVAKTAELARDFRSRIASLPFEITARNLSNAVTPIHPTTAKASAIVSVLKDQYGIWVCPNGGELADYQFRVGHIGDLTIEDNDVLIAALGDMQARGLI